MDNKKSFRGTLRDLFNKFIGDPRILIGSSTDMDYNKNYEGVSINILPVKMVSVPEDIKPEPVKDNIDCAEPEVRILPARILVGKNNIVKKYYLCVCNVHWLNTLTTEWLIRNFGDRCDEISNMWINITDTPIYGDSGITAIKHDFRIVFEEPEEPKLFNHMFVMYSDDENYLKYVKFELRKHFDNIKELEASYMNSTPKEHRVEAFKKALGRMKPIDENSKTLMSVAYYTGKKLGLSEEEIEKILKETKNID